MEKTVIKHQQDAIYNKVSMWQCRQHLKSEMVSLCRVGIFLLLLVIGGRALAQSEQVYTLKSCLEEGLRSNYALQITRNEQKISENNATIGNAGFLPMLDLTAGYSGSLNDTESTLRESGETVKEENVFDQAMNVGLNLNWTLFDGFSVSTTYKQLKELKRLGETNTRIAVEDFIASLSAEYYNYIQQKIRLKNFRYAVSLSKERMRIVEERYNVGNFSLLELQQAKVYFNEDSAQYIKQQEQLHSSRIRLNEMMGHADVDRFIVIRDTLIDVCEHLASKELWDAALANNANLLRADQNASLAQLDYKKALSRNYPYLKLNTGYGYTRNRYDISSTKIRENLGLNMGVTVGFHIFDWNRIRERRNAALGVENARLKRRDLELGLRSDLSNLWQAYRNNLEMLKLERQNLVVAKKNYEIAVDRYMLGNLSGIEMREAQKSFLDAEERILSAEYDTKLCEISLLQMSGKIVQYLE